MSEKLLHFQECSTELNHNKGLTSKNRDIFIMGAIIFLLSCFFVFWRLGAASMNDWDEGIYASIAGDMMKNTEAVQDAAKNTSGGLSLNLYLQGEKWLEKEPLGIWLTAVSQKIFGFNEFATRLPSAIFTIFIPLLVFLIALAWLKKPFAFLCGLLFLFSPMLWNPHIARSGDFDLIFLSLFLASVFVWIKREACGRKSYFIIGAFLAAAFLIRGVFAFIPLLLILGLEIYSEFFSRNAKNLISRLAPVLIISLLPWLLWQGYNFYAHGAEFFNVYWKEQSFGRAAGALQGHSGKWNYYADYFLLQARAIFWLGLLGFLLIFYKMLGAYSFLQNAQKIFGEVHPKKNHFFIFIWFMLTVVPLQILKTKLYWYSVPALPPLFILSIYAFQEIYEKIFLGKKFLGRAAFIFISLYLLFYLITWPIGLTKAIYNLKANEIKELTETIEAWRAAESRNGAEFEPQDRIAPMGSDTVIYRVGGWNFGRLLPSWYWYLTVRADLNPILIASPENRDHYVVKSAEYPFWITDTDGVMELENISGLTVEKSLYKGKNLILVKISYLDAKDFIQ